MQLMLYGAQTLGKFRVDILDALTQKLDFLPICSMSTNRCVLPILTPPIKNVKVCAIDIRNKLFQFVNVVEFKRIYMET